MTSIPDHYAALGIDPTADQEVITAAYRALAKKFHPDTGATTGTANPERFEQIQQAYEVLRTPESRHRYDLALLEASERELAERLAAKRRIVPFEAAPQAAPPPPDLGEIRPEPAIRPTVRRPVPRRPVGPFLVPVVLLLTLAGGSAWLLLPRSPDAPPLPPAPQPAVVASQPKPPVVVQAPKPAVTPEAGPKPVPMPEPEQPPLFGSTATDDQPMAPVQQASTRPVAPEPGEKPLFGSSLDDQPPLAPAAEDAGDAGATDVPPLPKPRPAQAAKPQAAPQQQAAKPQPQAQPDPPPQRVAIDAGGPFRLVIFQRPPGGETMAWSAGMMFDTRGSCTEFGVKSVLRRLAAIPPDLEPPKIWYECQPR